MTKFLSVVVTEFKKLLPPTIFFFIALQIVALIHTLMEEGTPDVTVATTEAIIVGSLILGKAVLIADVLPAINRWPEKPLAYNIAWKTAIYFIIAGALHYVERLIHAWRETGSFANANEYLLAHIVWSHFWAIQIVLLILIVSYVSMHEVTRVLGRETMFSLFFGKNPIKSITKDIQKIHITVEGQTQ